MPNISYLKNYVKKPCLPCDFYNYDFDLQNNYADTSIQNGDIWSFQGHGQKKFPLKLHDYFQKISVLIAICHMMLLVSWVTCSWKKFICCLCICNKNIYISLEPISLEPKPSDPLLVASKLVDSCIIGKQIFSHINCAIRSPVLIENDWSLKLNRRTFTYPQ